MSKLSLLQQTFLHDLYEDHPCAIVELVKAHSQAAALQHFTLYQDGIRLRFIKALTKIYPVCLQLVGEDFFQQMLQNFIRETPSYSADLNQYGGSFADFIAKYPRADSVPYLADVALFEWARQKLFFSSTPKHFNYVGLAERFAIDPEKIIFTLATGSTLLSSRYPLHDIWRAHQNTFTSFDFKNGHYYFLIYYSENGIHYEILSERDFQILKMIDQGETMQCVCERVITLYPTTPPEKILNQWIQAGIIESFI